MCVVLAVGCPDPPEHGRRWTFSRARETPKARAPTTNTTFSGQYIQ